MTLTMQQIERARKRFYAPAFSVVVSGRNLVRDLGLEIVSVEVDTTLRGMDRFSVVVNNAFNVAKREFTQIDAKPLTAFFEFGTEVEISMGYGGTSDLSRMMIGIVTELGTSFPSSGLPQLTISGYDHSYRLSRGRMSKSWGEDKRDSDVVLEIASTYNLNPKVERTKLQHPKIDQSQESTSDFLTRLANRNRFEWFVVGKDLIFRSPANDKQGDIELVWGQGLVSFSPEINLSEQVTEVEVHGWNVQTKRPIVGRARRGDELGRDKARGSGTPRVSGADVLGKVSKGSEGILRVRQPVFSQQDADTQARAILQRRAEGFVSGRGESIGTPEIRPNANVTLRGLGDMFSATLYVQQATHTVDASGYRTTFEIKDTTT